MKPAPATIAAFSALAFWMLIAALVISAPDWLATIINVTDPRN